MIIVLIQGIIENKKKGENMAKQELQDQVKALQEQLKIAQQSLQEIVHCCSDDGQAEIKKEKKEYMVAGIHSFLVGMVSSIAETSLSEIKRLAGKKK